MYLEVSAAFQLLLSVHHHTKWSVLMVVKCEALAVNLTAADSTGASTQATMCGSDGNMVKCILWIKSVIQNVFCQDWQSKSSNLYQASAISTIAGWREDNTKDPINLCDIFQKPQKLLVILCQGAPKLSWKLCKL